MAEAIAQAERERELTKRALESTIDRLEARVRAELDWKARLRRDGARYAVIGAAVLTVALTLLVLRARLRGKDDTPTRALNSMEDIAAELAEIRKRLEAAKVEPDSGPLWQKVALRGVSAAAAAGGTFAARRFMARATEPAVETSV